MKAEEISIKKKNNSLNRLWLVASWPEDADSSEKIHQSSTASL